MAVSKKNEQKKILSRMAKLSKEIRKYQDLYYIKNQSLISDFSFDQLLEELKTLEKEYPELSSPDSPTRFVGSDSSSNFKKSKHSIPILSLGNTYNMGELLEWAHKTALGPKTRFHVQWKLDGATLVLYYEEGLLKRALTRGTGLVGDDVTENAFTIRSIPHSLKRPVSLAVRGEVYMRYSDFEQFNQSFSMAYANPRNLAAGSLKHKKSSEVALRPLRWLAFDGEISIKGRRKRGYKSDLEVLREMKALGLPLSPSREEVCVPLSDLEKTIEEFSHDKKKLDFPVDGLVIKLDNLSLRRTLGSTANAPRWAVAYKFEPEYAISTVRAIESFVGRTGRVTPRATLDPVALAGTTVQHATLHNADFVKKLDLRLGSQVRISKRGDIIPAIEEVLKKGRAKPYSFPEECPSCHSRLSRDKDMVDWLCLNKECPGKLLSRIVFFCARKQMDIASLGEKVCELLFEKSFLRSIPDIYDLHRHKDELEKLDGLGKRSVELLLDGVEASKKKSFQTLLASLGLLEIGPNVSELLLEAGHNSYTKILKVSVKEDALEKIKEIKEAKMPSKKASDLFKEYFAELSQIHGIGWRTARAIIEQFNEKEIQELFSRLQSQGLKLHKEEVKQDPSLSPIFAGQSWCITGSFSHFKPRDLAAEEIKKRGGKVLTSPSSKTTRLLAGEGAGSKLEKAKKLGIQIISEEEFLKSLGRDVGG